MKKDKTTKKSGKQAVERKPDPSEKHPDTEQPTPDREPTSGRPLRANPDNVIGSLGQASTDVHMRGVEEIPPKPTSPTPGFASTLPEGTTGQASTDPDKLGREVAPDGRELDWRGRPVGDPDSTPDPTPTIPDTPAERAAIERTQEAEEAQNRAGVTSKDKAAEEGEEPRNKEASRHDASGSPNRTVGEVTEEAQNEEEKKSEEARRTDVPQTEQAIGSKKNPQRSHAEPDWEAAKRASRQEQEPHLTEGHILHYKGETYDLHNYEGQQYRRMDNSGEILYELYEPSSANVAGARIRLPVTTQGEAEELEAVCNLYFRGY